MFQKATVLSLIENASVLFTNIPEWEIQQSVSITRTIFTVYKTKLWYPNECEICGAMGQL
jgi:hypothetical protein